VQERLTDAIARELKELKYVGLDQMAARLATRKLVAALTRTLADVAEDPDHELRHRFDGWMLDAIDRMQHDADWQTRVVHWRDAWLDQPNWAAPISAWWHELMTRLNDEAQKPESILAERLATVVQAAGEHLLADAALRQWFNEQAQQGLLALLERSRDSLVGFVAQRVQAWDAQEMSQVLERNIGRDLQFIRINGTLVGALVGLLLHALTQLWLT
jgi:uncharacterized membrane-anchored protein YjiN (DUF445 family)